MKTANWPPLSVFSGALGLVICYVMLVLFCGFFRCFRRFGVVFELVFNSDCIRHKGKCSVNAAWSEGFWSGENKLHHRKARAYETICSRSLVSGRFYSGPSVACLVRMRDDVLLSHSWDSIIYSVHEHDFKSPWLWDVNRTRGNSHSSLAIFCLITKIWFYQRS